MQYTSKDIFKDGNSNIKITNDNTIFFIYFIKN